MCKVARSWQVGAEMKGIWKELSGTNVDRTGLRRLAMRTEVKSYERVHGYCVEVNLTRAIYKS